MSTEPGLTPDEALRRAHAWWQAAASSSGPYRAEAERAAAYWSAQHRYLVERGAPRRRGAGRTVRAVLLATVVCVVAGVSLVGGVRGLTEAVRPDDGSVLPTEADGAVPPPTVWEDASPGAAPLPGGTEERWRAGELALTLPDPVPGAEQTTPFLPAYPDPTDWVVALNPANEGVQVVFTDDETYNCGMAHVVEHDAGDHGVAGCFHPSYPTTLFVWWADGADPATKEFLLAHELSHMVQWWHDFDVMRSAYDSGLEGDEAWLRAVETDASCRVLSWGGYSRAAADRSSSPCDADDWAEGWLEEQAEALGAVVRDH